MELEELTNIETKSCVILCLKCLAKGEYTIPSLELNELNEIVYKCTKILLIKMILVIQY